MTETTTSDEVFDVFEQAEPEVAEETEDQAPTEEQKSPEEEGSPEDDTEDYEEDGKTYRVPKDLKGHLLRQRDYTQKTQELAEQRRAFEAERVKAQENDEAIEEARYTQRQIQKRLSDLHELTADDWNQIRIMDQQRGTNRYDELQREFLTLPRQAEEAKRTLDQKISETRETQQQMLATQFAQGQAELARDIPGWGPELGAKLVDFVGAEYGVTEQKHGHMFMDPALVKLAYAAFKAKGDQQKAQTAKRAEQAQKTVPANTVKGGAAPKAGLHDKLSTEEWAARRNREIAAKGRP